MWTVELRFEYSSPYSVAYAVNHKLNDFKNKGFSAIIMASWRDKEINKVGFSAFHLQYISCTFQYISAYVHYIDSCTLSNIDYTLEKN